MTKIIGAPTLDDALAALAAQVKERESRGGKNLIFCEDKLTLLAERAVLQSSGGTMLTEVSSFSRFLRADRKILSKQGSVMAISAILAACEGELGCFRKNAAQAVYETIAQLSASRVDAAALRASAEQAEGLLRLKLCDLALVFERYEAFLHERELLDENGYLALLPEKIASGALADTHVFFFAFPSFTAQAREGVRAAIAYAGGVTGIFIAGGEEWYTNEGARCMKHIAGEFGQTQSVMTGCSLEGDALELQRGLFLPERFSAPQTPSEQVCIFRAEDETEEFRTVCALIKKHTAEGLRYQDIAVLTGGCGSFSAIEKMFLSYRIPYFSDRKRTYDLHPLGAFVLSVLEAVAGGLLPEAVDTVLASVYFGKGDCYRNYLLKFGGYRGAVKREIKEGEAVKDYDRDELTACRKRLLDLLSFVPAKGTGAEYAAAVRALCAYVHAEETTEALRARVTGAEREFLDTSPLGNVLAETEAVAGGQKFTAREFCAVLKNGLSALEISMIPQFADAVYLGDVTESRLPRAEVLFCTGLTDEVPRVSADTAVITDGDIRKLSELSLQIEPAIAVVNARAREAFALNLCAFRAKLYLSRPLRKGDAETAESEGMSYAARIFCAAPLPDLFPYDCCEAQPAALALLRMKEDFEAGRENDVQRFSSLCAVLKRTSGETFVRNLLSCGEKGRVPAAGKLYFEREISPTLLESYFSCPYAGFAVRGLKLREREERTVLDTDAGTFVHAVLERTARQFNRIGSEDELRAVAEGTGEELLRSPRFQSLADTRAGAYTGERLVREGAAVSLAAYLQLKHSAFQVAETEGRLSLPELSLLGKADRVDRSDEYVRIVDYKTGEIDDRAVSYYTGRKLQLQLYLLAAAHGGKPAGAFYFPAADDFSKEGEEKFRMKGFFSKEEEVLSRMDTLRAEGEKSRFFEGGGRTEKGMPQEDFERFLDYARLVSAGAEAEMRAGNIAPSPYEGACDYCKCKGMCAFTGTPRKEKNVGCGEIVKIVRRAKGEEV